MLHLSVLFARQLDSVNCQANAFLCLLASRADTATATVKENQYDYHPSLAAGVIFVLLFSALSIVHLGILIKSRIWWTSVILIGGVGELLGWVGRLWSSRNDTNHSAFLLQIVLLVIVPSFFSAACYGITGMLIRLVGPEFSVLGPRKFLRVFCTVDFISILIQVGGGVLASSKSLLPPHPVRHHDDVDISNTGTHVMLAGIIFQLISMIVFSLIAVHFYLRARATLLGRPTYSNSFDVVAGVDALATGPVKTLVWTLGLASLAIIVRGVYRTVELAEGWHGQIMAHEAYFDLFDAVPMVFCMAFLTPSHPYFGLPNHGRPLVGARAFADDEAATKMVVTAPVVSKPAL